jgi:hypothetical protein
MNRTEIPMNLTDTQLVLLSAASLREDGGIQLSSNLKGAAARKVLDKLRTEGLIEEVAARDTLPVWRRDGENRALALRITKHGLHAIRIDDTELRPGADKGSGTERGATWPARRAPARRRSKTGDKAPKQPAGRARTVSKQAGVIEMLRRRRGASVAAIMKATGWQPHSVRGFLAGVVRKKLGLTLVSEKSGDQRVYRIVADKTATRSKGKAGRKAA